MRSQSSVLAHTTKSLGSLALTSSPAKEQHSLTAPVGHLSSCGGIGQMSSGGGASHKSVSSCNTTTSNSSVSTLSISSTISSILRHSNGNLSMNNNNNTSACSSSNTNNKNSTNNSSSSNNNNNNDVGSNSNANWSKMQTLEARKLELENLLKEKNWLLKEIHRQESQILNGNYENLNALDLGKGTSSIGANMSSGISSNIGTVPPPASSGATNSILRRKGSSSLKLNKSNVHFNGKNNRLTLSKSDYDLAQENKLSGQSAMVANPNVMNIKKRQCPPQKTNSFHDSTSTSALSLTKSPSFEYNGSPSQTAAGDFGSHGIKYSMARQHHGSSENLNLNLNTPAVTHCDKYYLSPTSQMYSDATGFIKASQNIKQCLSPPPMRKIIGLNDMESHRSKQHSSNGHGLMHHNGSQPHLEQYEAVDSLSLSPSAKCMLDHGNLCRAVSGERAGWCDTTSYLELDSDGGNPYMNLKPLTKKIISGSSLSPESPSLGNFYPVGLVAGNYPNIIEKSCDEVSISSVNSETNKKPKNKQWMESSLDGPIIRPNLLQTMTTVPDTMGLCPALSPTLSQNPQYSYYTDRHRQPTSSSAAAPGNKMAPSPAPPTSCRPPTRTLTHHSHPHQKQNYRERTKLSSQSMSSGSYRAPKTKLDEDANHLSHSTSYLNVDPYHHHHFHLQPPTQPPQQPQMYHHNHYHMDMPGGSSSYSLSHLQPKVVKPPPPAVPIGASSNPPPPLPKFSPTMVTPQNGDDFLGPMRFTQPPRSCQPTNLVKKGIPPSSLYITPAQQLSPQGSASAAATSPDIRIESPKNMTVVQQATFLPYKEVTKPFEMSDFYKYSTKFRQKEANTATISKSTT